MLVCIVKKFIISRIIIDFARRYRVLFSKLYCPFTKNNLKLYIKCMPFIFLLLFTSQCSLDKIWVLCQWEKLFFRFTLQLLSTVYDYRLVLEVSKIQYLLLKIIYILQKYWKIHHMHALIFKEWTWTWSRSVVPDSLWPHGL